MTKRVNYLALSTRTGLIKDNTGRVYTIPEARQIMSEKGKELSVSLSLMRLSQLRWDIEALKAYYKAEIDARVPWTPEKAIKLINNGVDVTNFGDPIKWQKEVRKDRNID